MDQRTEQYLLSIVQQNYETIATEFSHTRKGQLWPTLLEIASKAKGNILDVGCANGRLRKAWIGQPVDYTGVEPSFNLLKLAEKEEVWRLPRQRFIQGDVLSLDKCRLKGFDWVFCIAVIHHIPGTKLRRKALDQLLDTVEPGGRLVISSWVMWHHKKYVRTIVKNAFLKTLGLSSLDFGDIVFSGFDQESPRYYHAFTKKGFRKFLVTDKAELESLFSDGKNYYAVLRRR